MRSDLLVRPLDSQASVISAGARAIMSNEVSRRVGSRFGGIAALIALATSASFAWEPASEPHGSDPDCGVNALYLLCQIEGRPVELAQVTRGLPTRDPRGFSMMELARAAEAVGLPLDGIEIRRGEVSIDRTGIAYLSDGGDGHFVLVRPIGTTGKMVQVLDPPSFPRVMEYQELTSVKSWTGRMLVPRTSCLSHYFLPLVTGASGVTLLIASVCQRAAKGRGPGAN